MTAARDEILARLARARPPATERPESMPAPGMPVNPVSELRNRVEEAGGRFQSADRNGWPEQIDWPIDRGSASHIYSSTPAIESRGVGLACQSQTTESAQSTDLRTLASLDLCVLNAEFAVVENGAVWHRPTSAHERAAALLATHLIVIVDAAELVATLHQAYARIDTEDSRFGWFLSGPSKTADIEQALVLGAHGPCSMSLIHLQS